MGRTAGGMTERQGLGKRTVSKAKGQGKAAAKRMGVYPE